MNDLIKFHDPYEDVPDWHVKNCHTLLIAETSEMVRGIENLWNRGKYNGRLSYTDFGQYATITSFKTFCSRTAYAWATRTFGIFKNVTDPGTFLFLSSVIQ